MSGVMPLSCGMYREYFTSLYGSLNLFLERFYYLMLYFLFFGYNPNIGGKITHTVKYADDLVLMVKEETVLRG